MGDLDEIWFWVDPIDRVTIGFSQNASPFACPTSDIEDVFWLSLEFLQNVSDPLCLGGLVFDWPIVEIVLSRELSLHAQAKNSFGTGSEQFNLEECSNMIAFIELLMLVMSDNFA